MIEHSFNCISYAVATWLGAEEKILDFTPTTQWLLSLGAIQTPSPIDSRLYVCTKEIAPHHVIYHMAALSPDGRWRERSALQAKVRITSILKLSNYCFPILKANGWKDEWYK